MRTPRPLAAALFAASFALACSESPSGPDGDGRFDGNFIAGDAEPFDAGAARDAAPGEDGAVDAGVDLDGGPGSDAGGLDGGGADGGLPDVDPCAAAATATVTPAEAVLRADELAGEVIELTGTATQTGLDCSERECPPEDPCCNTCTARIRVGQVFLQGSACFDPAPGCAGTECAQACRPALLGLPQQFRGRLSTAAPDLELLLHRVR